MNSLASVNSSEACEDDLEGVIRDLNEMVAEVGVRAVVAAALRSEAGDGFAKLGGNATLRISQFILRQIAFAQDPQLEAEIMAMGVGVILAEGDTVTRIARKHGLTKQAVSKRIVAFCEENGLPPSEFMRSEKDRRVYALSNQPRMA